MKTKDQILLEEAYFSIYNESAGSSKGIAFRKDSKGNDVGAAIGVEHGVTPELSDDLIFRIKSIKGLKGAFTEGADRDPIDPILERIGIKKVGNWDELLGNDKGARNPKYNSVYIFMQSNVKGNSNHPSTFSGKTIEDAILNWKNAESSNINVEKAIEDIKTAGFGEYLAKPFSEELMGKFLQKMEDTVYVPPRYQLNPKSFFGTKMNAIEHERNISLFNCMDRGIAFTGSGHLTELASMEKFKPFIQLLDANKAV